MNINNTKNIINSIPNNVLLVAVTKNQSIDDINKLLDLGITNFAENKLQSIIDKKEFYPEIKWHFIGRIQTNKIKDIVNNCVLIHSVSSYKVLDIINKEAHKINITMPCLIQFNVANEDTKDGFNINQAKEVFSYANNLTNIKLQGIMLMGPHTEDEKIIDEVFNQGYHLQQTLVKDFPNCIEISMGMSNDYKLAINNHSTMLRIGSLLFR
jgi:pyridoxal phosphate enzyme (YggS family)